MDTEEFRNSTGKHNQNAQQHILFKVSSEYSTRTSLRTGLGKTDAHCPGRIDQYLLIEEYRPVVAEYAGGCRRRIQKEVFFHIAAADREVLAVRGDYPEVGPAAGRFGVRPVYPFSGRDNKGIVCE